MDRTVTTPGGTVGCYHIRLRGTYDGFEDAARCSGAYAGGFPAYYDGEFYALAGEYESASEAQSALDASGLDGEVFTASSRCVTVTRTADARHTL